MIRLAYGVPKGILLDLDDTILMGANASEECWRAVCTCFAGRLDGISVGGLCNAINEVWDIFWSNPECACLGRRDMRGARRQIVAMAFSSLHVRSKGLEVEMADAYEKLLTEVTVPVPGAMETLETLRTRGFRLGLLSNGDGESQRSKLKRFGLDRFFDTIVIEGEFGRGKPDPFMFEYALDKLNVKPADAWMIGDDLRGDVAPAQRLGILGIWVDTLGRGVPKFSRIRPDRIVRSFSDISASL